MQGQIKKIIVFSISFSFLVFGIMVQSGYGQRSEASTQPASLSDSTKGFIKIICDSISSEAAQIGFDYDQRPVVGILVSDFYNSAGEEIDLGNQIALELRATLNSGKQFHVYGKEHPVSQSLKTSLTSDPPWRVSSQRKFQQNLLNKFAPFPVDLIITGLVSPESGNRLKVTVNLIPFYKPITLVESESRRTDILRKQFFSPDLSTQEIDKGLAVIKISKVEKGRLIVVSLMKIMKSKYPGREILSSKDRAATKIKWDTDEVTEKPLSLKDINCWLDDKELSVIKDWDDIKKKEYYNILSGFGADTIWFEDHVIAGPHSIFFSIPLGPSSKQFKTISKPFSIKSGTTNYLFFSIHSVATGELEVRVRHILDPENRSLPF
jgi:hypothetical protein